MTDRDTAPLPTDRGAELRRWLDEQGQMPPTVRDLVEREIRRLAAPPLLPGHVERAALGSAAAQIAQAQRQIDVLRGELAREQMAHSEDQKTLQDFESRCVKHGLDAESDEYAPQWLDEQLAGLEALRKRYGRMLDAIARAGSAAVHPDADLTRVEMPSTAWDDVLEAR